MKKPLFIISLLLAAAVSINAQEKEFLELTGPYLGQTPPGMTPEIFAPGIISRKGFRHYGITFSKGNDLLLYTCDAEGSEKQCIYFSSNIDGQWMEPKPIPFSANHSIGEPVFSPVSDRIYFGELKLNANKELEPFICFTRKSPTGWDYPVLLFPGLFASEANDGTLYFTDVTLGKRPMEKTGIAKSEWVNGLYQEPRMLESDINTEFNEFHPFVSPDESYLIFDSDRPGGFGSFDIYVVFKDKDGGWGQAINLGRTMNSERYEGVATVSLDGQYLFFNRDNDIYWVSAKVIEELRPKELKQRGKP